VVAIAVLVVVVAIVVVVVVVVTPIYFSYCSVVKSSEFDLLLIPLRWIDAKK